MTLARYDTLFEDFLQKIALTNSQADLIDGALEDAVAIFMSKYDGDVDIYTQGSYTMGTIVRPLTSNQSKDGVAGEYDIDIVLERSSWSKAIDSLASIKDVLSEEYGAKVDGKARESCERVIHNELSSTGVTFHADYVPIKPFESGRAVAKRSENKWYFSDTKRLVDWFQENYAEKHTFLPALIAIIKRIRDYSGLTDELPSLCITAIICNHYVNQGSYAGDLLFMIDILRTTFSVPHEQLIIKIDPLGDENLARKISQSAHIKIFELFDDCLQALRIAFSEAVQDMSGVAEYLSDDFPTDLTKYPSFLESLRSHTFGIELIGLNTNGDIAEVDNKGSKTGKRRIKFFTSGESLLFKANQTYDSRLYSARWQVLNSEQSEDRRGKLFYAQKGGGAHSSNAFVNRETERYGGEHWIRCFIYNIETKKVVEVGQKYYVEVEKE